jgi:hypothetical protein
MGYKLIVLKPHGSGVFRSFPEQIEKIVPKFSGAPYTHSGWIDLGLSFGIIGLALFPMAFMIALMRFLISHSCKYRATITSLSLAMLALYSVGEYEFQHGIEILFYVGGLVSGLTLISSAKPKSIRC